MSAPKQPVLTMPSFLSKFSWDRPVLSYGKVQNPISAVIRGRKTFADIKREGLILNIGCGPNSDPKNINLDYHWQPGVDVCWDITKPLPFDDDYVAGIFTEHCLEHIQFDRVLFAMREFYRVMKPGSVLRVVVPDLEIYIDRYDDYRTRGEVTMPFAFIEDRPDGIYSAAMSVNRVMRNFGHAFIYDFLTMREMLKKTGFVDITKRKFGEGANPALVLDTKHREPESLYVEARKP